MGWLSTYFPCPCLLSTDLLWRTEQASQLQQCYACPQSTCGLTGPTNIKGTRAFLSTPQASFNHFVQLIIAVITFPDSFLVCKSKTSLSLLSLLEGASLYFVAEVPFMIFILIHSGAFSSRKHALVSIIHTVESAEVNVS